MVREFPKNLDYQHDLGWTYFRLGYSRLCSFWFHGSSIAEAEEPVRQAVAIREKLVAESPGVFSYRQELGMSLGNLGNILTVTGRHKEAEKVVQRNLALRQKLVDDFPAEPEARHYLADAYHDLASLHMSAGKFQGAVQALRQELPLRQKLTAEFPSVRRYQEQWARCNYNLGHALKANGALEEAITALKEAIHFKPDEAGFHINLGALLCDGKHDYEGAIAAFQEAIRLKPDKPDLAQALNAYAWLLATCPQSGLRNPTQAGELAKKATELAPKVGGYWNTLGVAQYRLGNWRAATTALERSMVLQKGGDACDWLFLAMAHWQLGQKEDAHKWYDQAVSWMDKNKNPNEELSRFRAEARALFKLQGPEAPQEPETSPRKR